MTTLTDFLLARIAEDEYRLDLPEGLVVLNSHGEVSARGDGWVSRGECPVCGAYQYDGTESVTEDAWWEHAETVHQRARVLAECDAKRRIIEAADEATGLDMQVDSEFRIERRDERQEPYIGDVILRALALPYADHPDYREEWRA